MNVSARFGIFFALGLMAASPGTAQDWSGFYGGISAGPASGDWTHILNGGGIPISGDYSSAAIVGGFLGYNIQHGNMVYGGELAFSHAGSLCFAEFSEECTDKFVDLKGRVGFASGKALFYGTVGLSQAEYVQRSDGIPLEGIAYGLGVDYAISEKFFIGGELLRRQIEGEILGHGTIATDHEVTSISLRLGMKF